ncbi:hypothetical protein PIB30_054948 [Stylosanthes scabra]|uniref:Uncharacterized protein n=1 Tax=Stylosanthes scabra TaxID=79078 RepID=A0ABU6QIK6_9FABA|nr:hypothetical protein [Stylosanthes scabra]
MNANAVPPPHQPVVEEDNAANEDVVQQPHQNVEEDNNAAAASDAVVGPSCQLTVNLSGDSESQDRDVNPAAVPTATREIVPESDARDTTSVVGTAIEVEGVEEECTQADNTLERTQDGDSEIVYASFEDPPTSVEEETTLTNLVQNITTQQHDHDTLENTQDASVVHFSIEDPPTSIEKEMPFANIVQNITTQQHNDVLEDIQHGDAAIVEKEIALTPLFQNIATQQHNDVLEDIQHGDAGIVEKEKAVTPLFLNIDPKEDVAVVDSQTLRPSFDLGLGLDLGSIFGSQSQPTLSQGQPQMAEIHGTRVEGAKIENQPTVSQGQPQMA